MGGIQLGSGNGIRYKLRYKHYGDEITGDDLDAKHVQAANKMLAAVDFVVGTHPKFAVKEIEMTNAANMVNVVCCTGPNPVYEAAHDMAWNGAFGVHGPPEKYPQGVLKLAIAKGARTFALIYEANNVFTSGVCAENKKYLEDYGLDDIKIVVYKSYAMAGADGTVTTAEKAKITSYIEEAVAAKADFLLGCTLNDDAIHMAKEAERLDTGDAFQAVFLTV